jgi:hypothetical protein
MPVPTVIQLEALGQDLTDFDLDVIFETLREHLSHCGTVSVPDSDRDAWQALIKQIDQRSTGLSHELAIILAESMFPSEVTLKEFWGASGPDTPTSLSDPTLTRQSLVEGWKGSNALLVVDSDTYGVLFDEGKRSEWLDSKRQVEEVVPISRLPIAMTCRSAKKHLSSRTLVTDQDLTMFLDQAVRLMMRGTNRVVLSDRYLAVDCMNSPQQRLKYLRRLVEAISTHATRCNDPVALTIVTRKSDTASPEKTAAWLGDRIGHYALDTGSISETEFLVADRDHQVDHDRYLRGGRCGFRFGEGAKTLALVPKSGSSASYYSDLASFRRFKAHEARLRSEAASGDAVARLVM